MSDIVERLRAMSRYEHNDFTIGDEAADEIERLRAELSDAIKAIDDLHEKRRKLEANDER